MKIICTTLIFLLLVCSDLVAQTDSNVVLRNIFLKNNFNAGVSLGVGGVHPQIVMPTAMLKIGRIKLKGIGWGNDRWDSYSDGGFEFGVDALQLPSKSPNNRDYLTAGIGGMRYNSLFQDKQWYQTHSYMLGLARYTHGKRGVWEGKLGVATIEKYGEVEKMGWYKPYTTYERSSRKIIPYAEVSYSLYLAPFGSQTKFDWATKTWKTYKQGALSKWQWNSSNKLEKHYDNEEDSIIGERKLYLMSRYLNPGISFGLGGGRLIYGLPSMSIKIGALVLKGAIMPSTPYLSFAWQGQLNLFEIKKHKIWPNTKVYPTLSLGVSKFTAFNEMQAFRNYELLGGLNFEKKSSHLTWAFKVGANDLKREKFIEGYGYWGKFRGIVPFAEVALSVHVFKQRAKPVYLDSSGASIAYEQSEAKKFQDRNVTNRPLLSKYFNPRISLGLGSTHPVLVFPSVGVKIGRFDGGLGVGVDPFSNDLAITLSADIDAFKIKKDSKKFFTIGACAGIAGWNFLAATHVGVKKYYERSSFNWKAGVGFYESYPLPSVDLSYHYYLFKF